MVGTQSKYTIEDVLFILLPVLQIYQFVVTSCAFITPEGKVAKEALERGEIPELPKRNKKEFDLLQCIRERDACCDMEEGVETDVEGYVAMCTAVIELQDMYCAYTTSERYLWGQVYKILCGELVATRDILSPLFTPNERLKVFLGKHIERGEAHFDAILEYVVDICPYA